MSDSTKHFAFGRIYPEGMPSSFEYKIPRGRSIKDHDILIMNPNRDGSNSSDK